MEIVPQVIDSCCMSIVAVRGLEKLKKLKETEITVEVGGVDPCLTGGGGGGGGDWKII